MASLPPKYPINCSAHALKNVLETCQTHTLPLVRSLTLSLRLSGCLFSSKKGALSCGLQTRTPVQRASLSPACGADPLAPSARHRCHRVRPVNGSSGLHGPMQLPPHTKHSLKASCRKQHGWGGLYLSTFLVLRRQFPCIPFFVTKLPPRMADGGPPEDRCPESKSGALCLRGSPYRFLAARGA